MTTIVDIDYHGEKLNWSVRDIDQMRRETQACHGCYGINSVLAIKINIVLEIKIDSSASADKREDTRDVKALSEVNEQKQLPFKFKVS